MTALEGFCEASIIVTMVDPVAAWRGHAWESILSNCASMAQETGVVLLTCVNKDSMPKPGSQGDKLYLTTMLPRSHRDTQL
jgi:hypothetical protein